MSPYFLSANDYIGLSDDELYDFMSSLFDSTWEYRTGGPDRPLSHSGASLTEPQVLAICEEALLRRQDQTISIWAIDLLTARPSVDAHRIVIEAAKKSHRTSTEDIHLLDFVFQTSVEFPDSLYLDFLDTNKAELVRQFAARVLLLKQQVANHLPFLELFVSDSDEIVRINLAATLYQATGDPRYMEFIRKKKKSAILDIARSAKECEGILLTGEPTAQ